MDEKDNPKVRVFGSDEDSLKMLGQLLSNETSRKIISCLNGNEMYINQISKACGIQMNLTIHHIKKLEELGLVTITEKPIVRKGVDHKFYKMIPNVFVNVTQTKQEMEEKGFFKKIFKEGVKFASIGFIAFSSFVIINYDKIFGSVWQSGESGSIDGKYDLTIPLLIIIFGLLVLFFKKRKKG